jgi:hypothetical protein
MKLHNGKVKMSLNIIKHEAMKTYGCLGVPVRMLWLVSFTLHTLLCGKWPGYIFDMRLGEPQSHLEVKTTSFFARDQTLIIRPVAVSLYWLSYPSFYEHPHYVLFSFLSLMVTLSRILPVMIVYYTV